MEELKQEIFEKLETLNLIITSTDICKKLLTMAISSAKNFISIQINPIIQIEEIKHSFIQIAIGEYLTLIKASTNAINIDFDNIIKTIKAGDTSMTYFDDKNKDINTIIDYFFKAREELISFRSIKW